MNPSTLQKKVIRPQGRNKEINKVQNYKQQTNYNKKTTKTTENQQLNGRKGLHKGIRVL